MRKTSVRLLLAMASLACAWGIVRIELPPPELACGRLIDGSCHQCCVDAKNDFKANLCDPLSGGDQAACEHRVNDWFQNCLSFCSAPRT